MRTKLSGQQTVLPTRWPCAGGCNGGNESSDNRLDGRASAVRTLPAAGKGRPGWDGCCLQGAARKDEKICCRESPRSELLKQLRVYRSLRARGRDVEPSGPP